MVTGEPEPALTARDAMLLRTRLVDRFSRPDERERLAGWLQHISTGPDDQDWLFHVDFECQTLAKARLFLVTEDMTRLLQVAADSFPTFTLDHTDPPCPDGLVMFDRPLSFRLIVGGNRVDSVRAVSWASAGTGWTACEPCREPA